MCSAAFLKDLSDKSATGRRRTVRPSLQEESVRCHMEHARTLGVLQHMHSLVCAQTVVQLMAPRFNRDYPGGTMLEQTIGKSSG